MAEKYLIVDKRDLLMTWALETSPDRRAALLAWLGALQRDPRDVCDGVLVREGRAHRLHYVTVPKAEVMVTYIVLDAPVRTVIVVDVIDPSPG